MNKNRTVASIFFLFLLQACTPQQEPKEAKTQQLSIAVDESLQSVISQQIEAFENGLDSIHIVADYKNEKDLLNDFLSVKTRMIILPRNLTEHEKQVIKSKDSLVVKEYLIGYDAVAIVGNKNRSDFDLSADSIQAYFDAHSCAKVNLVFDNQNSGIVQYMFQRDGIETTANAHIFAMKSTEEVVQYLAKDESAIGFIPYQYIANHYDPKVKQLLSEIKVLNIQIKNDSGRVVKTSANQSDIATGEYPFRRPINVVTSSVRGEVAQAFISFMHKDKGAKVFLKAGYIPYIMPEREFIVP